MSIINNGLLLASGADAAVGYQISRSLRFNSADSAFLGKTFSSTGNRKTWTWSAWVKRSAFNNGGLFGKYYADNTFGTLFFSNDTLQFSCNTTWFQTTQVLRDPSAWYHIVLAVDTPNATANNRVRLYINGSEVTTFATRNNPTQNADLGPDNTTEIHIGRDGVNYLNGYLADVYYLDGTATTPSTFAETDAVTGQWVPKTPTGISYGTNGFRLTFSDNSGTTSTTLGKDAAGSNNWTPNNFSVASGSGNDSLTDSPTSYGTDTGAGSEVRGNYCTLNPLDSGGGTLSNGNLEHTYSSSNTRVRSTISIPETGKWYAEFVASNTGGGNSLVGVSTGTNALTGTNWYLGSDADSWGCQIGSGTMYTYHAGGYSSFGTAASGDVISVAVDRAAGKIWWAVNNTWIGSGNPATGANARYTDIPATGALFFAISNQNSSSIVCNFGQRAFAYTAPSGFKALCDTNLTAPVIAKPNTVMDVKLYTGNGSTQTISGLGFSPDFVWIKDRSQGNGHGLFDVIRGATKGLFSNLTNAEITDSNSLTSFDATGFSTGSGGTTFSTNINGNSYVGWTWDAGTTTTTNTQGSITSSVRANASAGFSIVSYNSGSSTGNFTLGHGLNVAPKFIIHKSRSTSNWWVYHASVVDDLKKYMQLNSTNAIATNSNNMWGGAFPTSSVFGVTVGDLIATSQDAIAYVFSPVAGYSSFGSYTGNGSADGPFVFCGFRPRFLLWKSTGSGQWFIHDTSRSPYNFSDLELAAETSGAEYSANGAGAGQRLDFLSNGFKVRTSNIANNSNGVTYIYAAFAESPFAYARAR